MNKHTWYRRATMAAALGGTAALVAVLGSHAGAFAADEPGPPPGPPPALAADPPGPPPAFSDTEQGPPPPPREGEQGGWQRRGGPDRAEAGYGDRQGPPRSPGRFRDQGGPGQMDRQGPPPSFDDFNAPRQGMRGRAEFAGPPPGQGFGGEARGPEGDRDRPCPPEARGNRQGMRQGGFERQGPPDPDTIFDAMDKDRSGSVSKEEFRSFHEQHRPPHPPMDGGSDDRRPPQRPFPQDDRPQG